MCDHFAGLGAAVRQVLIDEDRHGRAGGADDVEHLAKEFAARVELLQFFVEGVFTVLGDQENAVDGELAGAACERIGDGGALAHVTFHGVCAAEVGRGATCSMNRLAISNGGLCRPWPS